MTKTPSSLKWLIDKRARLSSSLEKAENITKELEAAKMRIKVASRELEDAKSDLMFKTLIQPKIIEQLKKEIAALDIALGMHEIQIDPNLIQPLQTYDSKRFLEWGILTKDIYRCLRIAGGKPVKTRHVVHSNNIS